MNIFEAKIIDFAKVVDNSIPRKPKFIMNTTTIPINSRGTDPPKNVRIDPLNRTVYTDDLDVTVYNLNPKNGKLAEKLPSDLLSFTTIAPILPVGIVVGNEQTPRLTVKFNRGVSVTIFDKPRLLVYS